MEIQAPFRPGQYLTEARLVPKTTLHRNNDESLLHAANIGNVKLTWALLSNPGVEVHPRNNHGQTPLSLAAAQGHAELVWLLLSRGDVDAYPRDKEGLTPLHHAVRNGRQAVMRIYQARDDVGRYLKDERGQPSYSMQQRRGS